MILMNSLLIELMIYFILQSCVMFFCGYKLGQHISTKRLYNLKIQIDESQQEHDKIIDRIQQYYDDKLNDINEIEKKKKGIN